MVPPQVLIVGAGPSGLVLALSLLKNGIPVRIIEKASQYHLGERGPGIMPRTLEVEHFLGIANDVKNAGLETPVLHFHDPNDPHRIVKSAKQAEDLEYAPAFPTTSGTVLSQWKHEEILRKHVEAHGGRIELGTAFVNLQQDEHGVIAELSKANDGKEATEKAKFAFVVGADGAHSLVRKALSIGFAGETRESGQLYIIDARIEGVKGGNNIYYWGDTKTKMVRMRGTPQPDVFQLFFLGEEFDLSPLKETKDIETVQKVMNAVIGREDIKILDITWRGEWRPNIRMADHFRVGRVFIVGDAGHVHPPTGGQGLNSSVQDSFNLAWKLALAVKDRAVPGLLDSYEVERIPVIAEMLRLSTGIFNKVANAEALHRAGAVMKAEAESDSKNADKNAPWFRGRKLFQLDLHYRWSTIVFDERFEGDGKEKAEDVYGVAGRATRAGDRAPDAPELHSVDGTKTRLFDVINPTKHLALAFGPSTDALALLEPLKERGADAFLHILVLPKGSPPQSLPGVDVLIDSEGHAYAGYGIQSDVPTVVVIRPDGMVGAYALSKDGLAKYATAVFAS